MERMSGLDATFLYFETPSMHMHVVATIVHDPSTVPGGYSFERVKETIAGRLHLAPPLRRKLASVPLNLHHPVWVEDPYFDLDYHLRRIACPSPGTERELAQIAADIAGRPLDRAKPLWELWIVEGLEHGFVGSVAKIHHSTTDGVSGANLLVHLLDLQPEPGEIPPPDEEWAPDPDPSDLSMLGYALWSRARQPLRMAGAAVNTVKALGSIVQRRLQGSSGMATPFSAPRTSFNAPISPHRRVALATVPLDEVKKVKDAFDVKVNDVVLAVASGALRRFLDRDGGIPERPLVAVCPVSVRPEEESGSFGNNRVSAMFTSLASNVEDPVDRLQTIADANLGAKEDHNAIGATFLQQWADVAAPNTFSLAARMYSSMGMAARHPVIHNLVISNVPGPRFPLYFAGAKLMALYPLGPVMHGAALNITVLSYLDTLYWGLIACRQRVPDLDELAAAIPEALAELVKAADSR